MDTVAAALIGAIVGSIGAQLVGARLAWSRERKADQQRVSQKYLLQLQDAALSVRLRVDNILDQEGRSVMSDRYYRTTTLYAFACLLAQKRRLLLDGVYVLLQDGRKDLGRKLLKKLEAFEEFLGREGSSGPGFQRYSRLVLAESVLERTPEGWGVVSFMNFSAMHGSRLGEDLQGAEQFLEQLETMDWSGDGTELLDGIGELLEGQTKIEWGRSADER